MHYVVNVPLETPALTMFRQAGTLSDTPAVPEHLRLFAEQADRIPSKVCKLVDDGELTAAAAKDFQQLIVDSCAVVMCHPIVAENRYLERFALGITFEQAQPNAAGP